MGLGALDAYTIRKLISIPFESEKAREPLKPTSTNYFALSYKLYNLRNSVVCVLYMQAAGGSGSELVRRTYQKRISVFNVAIVAIH